MERIEVDMDAVDEKIRKLIARIVELEDITSLQGRRIDEFDALKRVMLEVANELAPPGEWLEGEDQRARLARRLREAAR